MKDARAEDWRRRLTSKPERWRLRVDRIALEGVINVGTVEIPTVLPLTVICGPNGVGKSTLIKALYAIFREDSIIPKEEPLLAAGSASLSATFKGKAFTVERDLASAPLEDSIVRAEYIESSKQPTSYQAHFRTFDSVDDIINGLAKVTIDEKELGEISFLLGREYRSIDVYEYGEGDRWPFFEVARGDDRYDTRTMGAGELACFHLWWRLKYVEEDTLLFIEEPETYISPYAQKSFAALLMQFLFQRRCVAIVVSHSASFVEAAPAQSVIFVTRLGPNMEVLTKPPKEFLKKIGIGRSIDTVCCVEDVRAKDFLNAILREFAFEALQTTTVHVSGSDSEVTTTVSGTAELANFPRLFGVFDGDLRENLPKGIDGFCAALPGDYAVEKLFRVFVSANSEAIGTSVGQDVRPILDSLEGSDEHDWFSRLAESVSMTPAALLNVIFALWVKEEANSTACTKLVETIFPPLPALAEEEVAENSAISGVRAMRADAPATSIA